MKMTDEIRIEAPREEVFAALNNPEILRQAIPGCQDLKQTSKTELTGTVQAKVGPVKATFQGTVTLSDIIAPEGYTITGEGKGGAAGFAKGMARVGLMEDGDATILNYEVNAEVGGKLAQVGSRLIEGTSKKLANQFFTTFSNLVGPNNTSTEANMGSTSSEEDKKQTDAPTSFIWVSASVVAALLVLGYLVGFKN